MSIQIKRFKVRHNGKYYLPGQTLSLSQDEETRLVLGGYAEYIKPIQVENNITVVDVDSNIMINTDIRVANSVNNSANDAIESDTSELNINFDPDEYVKPQKESKRKK